MMNEIADSFYHAHKMLQERCKGRMKCMRACPTQALRVRNGKVSFLTDLCIDCGQCLSLCPEGVFVPVSDDLGDFSTFKYRIAVPSPVLYTQFGHDIPPQIVHKALKNIGFDEVVDVEKVSEELGFAMLNHLKRNPDIRPVISSYCPSIVRLIQVNYPGLVRHITPFDVPREIVAREIKNTYPKKLGLNVDEIGVIYISPCPAKIVSIKQPAEKQHSWIDGAVPIKDIFNIILPEIIEIKEMNDIKKEEFHYGTGWALMGHISRDVGAERCLSVAGFEHVKMILDDIENSKLRNLDFIEALACRQGCIGGAFCVENPYIARGTSIELEKAYGSPSTIDEEKVLNNYDRGYYFLEHPVFPRPTRSFHHDLSISIRRLRQKERILSKLPKKDCGLCGAPTCEAFADDCARGDADLTDCVFLKQNKRRDNGRDR